MTGKTYIEQGPCAVDGRTAFSVISEDSRELSTVREYLNKAGWEHCLVTTIKLNSEGDIAAMWSIKEKHQQTFIDDFQRYLLSRS